ncbi:phage holin family protein [Actinocorallia aurea]
MPSPRSETPPEPVAAEPVGDRRVAGQPVEEPRTERVIPGAAQPAPEHHERPAYDQYGRTSSEQAHDQYGRPAAEQYERPVQEQFGRSSSEQRTGTRPDAERERREAAARIEHAGDSLQSSVGHLFQQATEEMARMVRAEVRSAATEANAVAEANARKAAKIEQRGTLTASAIAGALGAAALVVALIAGLALLIPLWAAALGVGAVLVAAAAALGRASGRPRTLAPAKQTAPPPAPPTREDIPVRQYARH